MISTHAIPVDEFAALATTGGDHAAITRLRLGQYSKNVVLLQAVMQTAAESEPAAYEAGGFDEAYALLAAVQQRSPGTVAALLVHPQVGFWAGASLRRLLGTESADTPLVAQLGHLGAIAAAAAIRAGHQFDARVPVHDGQLMLPTLGLCTLDTGTPLATATVGFDGREVSVAAGPAAITLPTDLRRDGPGWAALRRLTAEAGGLRLELDLDDINPYRGGYRAMADRIADADRAGWQATLREAWSVLVRVAPERAAAMTAGLASLVPLAGGRFAGGESATSRDAFGAILLTRPGHGAAFAETLVHEFQHSKLDAVLDLVPLYQAVPGELFYSPARDDPRPIGGLLQGTYAFAGIADFWRSYQAALSDEHSAYARLEFANWREQVSRASEVMLESGRLTPPGMDFVSGLYAQIQQWDEVPTTREQRAVARDAADDHHARWRLNNLHPDAGEVATLARAWAEGGPCPSGGAYAPPAPTPRPVGLKINGRLQLRQLSAMDPARFARACADPDTSPDAAHASPADLAYLRGDHTGAVRRYREQIAREPEDIEHWAGLLLARRQLADDDVAHALATRPELVRAVHLAVREQTGGAPDPEALAGWLVATAPRHAARR